VGKIGKYDLPCKVGYESLLLFPSSSFRAALAMALFVDAGLAAGAGAGVAAFAGAEAGLRTVVINLRVLRLFEFELLERLEFEFELLERLELELLERLELELLRFELRRVFTRAGA